LNENSGIPELPPEARATKVPLDWSSYDEAQVREVSNMLHPIRTFVDEASTNRIRLEEKRERRRKGRPPVDSPSDVAKALLLQSYFGVSNRVAAGLVDLFKEKLGISNAFSYKTIERGYDPGPMTQILQDVFRFTNELGNSMEDTFSPRAAMTTIIRLQSGRPPRPGMTCARASTPRRRLGCVLRSSQGSGAQTTTRWANS
jgi:hypothetical protein